MHYPSELENELQQNQTLKSRIPRDGAILLPDPHDQGTCFTAAGIPNATEISWRVILATYQSNNLCKIVKRE